MKSIFKAWARDNTECIIVVANLHFIPNTHVILSRSDLREYDIPVYDSPQKTQNNT